MENGFKDSMEQLRTAVSDRKNLTSPKHTSKANFCESASQLAITCLMFTIETLKQGVKYVQI